MHCPHYVQYGHAAGVHHEVVDSRDYLCVPALNVELDAHVLSLVVVLVQFARFALVLGETAIVEAEQAKEALLKYC